jgi:hypothetical protein
MRRLLQVTLLLGLLFMVSGCGEPGYDYYGNPGYGYAPYSYGWYGRSYQPNFGYHHDWEDHHNNFGHHDTFWHGAPSESHFGGGHMGGFGGGHGGGFGGGHGGGGHR